MCPRSARRRPFSGRSNPWCPQHDHGPRRARAIAVVASPALNCGDLVERLVHRGRKLLVDIGRIVADDEYRSVPVSLQKTGQLVVTDPRQHGGVRDLVTVQMQDRKYGAVTDGIEEFVRVPARRERSCLRLAVADHARDDQFGIVEGGAVGVNERVAELAAFVYRSRGLGGHVARDPARERELTEQLAETLLVMADVGIDLGVRTLEICVGDNAGTAVTRPDHVDDIEVTSLDHPVQMGIDQVEPGRRAEVAEKPGFDVLGCERFSEQGIVEKVDLTDRAVVGRPPVSVDRRKLVGSEWRSGTCGRKYLVDHRASPRGGRDRSPHDTVQGRY